MLPENSFELRTCDKEQMIELIQRYKTHMNISRVCHCDRQTVLNKIKKLNIDYQIKHRKSKIKSKERKIGNKHKRWTGYEEISGNFYSAIKHNAKKRNIEFNISIKDIWNQYLKQNRKCFITEEELTFPKISRSKFYTNKGYASIDRIDNQLGYSKNNILIVHKDFNFYHWAWTKEEILYYSELIINPILGQPSTINNITLWYWSRLYEKMKRIKKRNLNVLISDTDIINQFNKQNGLCYYTGLSINFPNKVKERGQQTASIDRINSNKGYEIDNIVLCHKNINAMKSNLDINRFKFIAKMSCKNIPQLIINNLD